MTDIVRGLHNVKPQHQQAVVTIGNYDGVHLGHQSILQTVMAIARANNTYAGAMIFEPQPQAFFRPQQAAARLTSLTNKIALLADFGLDFVICMRFNASFAALSATAFADSVLHQALRVQAVVVGDDFRFGQQRQGDFNALQVYATQYGFTASRVPSYLLGGERVSSTRVRQALVESDFNLAAQLLGRPYAVCGKVIRGDQRGGRQLGVPTANIKLGHPNPLSGVFLVQVADFGYGVANLGVRPTVDGKRRLLEVHLFDFDGDLYGKRLQVVFLKKIRPEQRFVSLTALTQQIFADIKQAQAYLQEINHD